MEEEKEEKKRIIEKKAQFFKDKNVHVSLDSGRFYNGVVKEIGSDFLIITDRKCGDSLAFFSEILDIEPYKEKGEPHVEIDEKEFDKDGGFYQP